MDELELLGWKRHVFAAYAEVRAADDPRPPGASGAAVRDQLFRGHPQSPLSAEGRAAFSGLAYFDYDPALRVLGEVAPGDDAIRDVAASGGEVVRFRRFGAVRFELEGARRSSRSSGSTAYGGGVFLPFTDAHSRAARPTAGAGTCSTRSREPTWAKRTAASSSTSTSPTTRRARTTRAGSARSARRRTGCRSPIRAGEQHRS